MAIIACQDYQFNQVKAILFDKDGTLADSALFLKTLGYKRAHLLEKYVPGIKTMLLHTFGLREQFLDPAGLLAIGSRYDNEVAAATYIAANGYTWPQALSLAQSAFIEADQDVTPKAPQTPLFNGVKELLDTLMSRGIKLGLLSADSSKNVAEFVQYYNLGSYFECVMGIDAPPGKPHPSLVDRACQSLGVPTHHLLIVGDSPADIQLAQLSGAVGCIAVGWGWADVTHLSDAEAIATHFSDIRII